MPYTGYIMKLFYKYIILTVILLLSILHVPSLSQYYLIDTYDLESGLPSSSVYDVEQDTSQELWFATRTGITLYDGYTWENYPLIKNSSNLIVQKLEYDANDILWALANRPNLTIAYFNGAVWVNLNTTPSLEVTSKITSFKIYSGPNVNRFFAGTEGAGLYVCDNKKWTRFTTDNGLPDNRVNSIAKYENRILIATMGGLCEFKDGNIIQEWSVDQKLHDREVLGLYYDKNLNRLWISIEDNIGYLENNQYVNVTYNPGYCKNKSQYCWFKLQPDAYQGLYYGNPHIVYYYDNYLKKNIKLGIRNGLITEGLTSVKIDKEKNIWITSLRGISKISSMRFSNFTREHGLLQSEVTAIVEVEPNCYVFGHNTGLTIYKDGVMKPIAFDGYDNLVDTQKRVLDMVVDDNKNIWFVAGKIGLGKLDLNGNIEWFQIKNNTMEGEYTSIVINPEGEIIVSVWDRLYFLRDGVLHEDKNFPWKEVKTYIRKLVPAKDGSIYILSPMKGYIKYDGHSIVHIAKSTNTNENSVYSVYDNYKDMVLVGTLDGLYYTQGDSIVRFERYGFMIDRPVYTILKDKVNRLWFGTSNGVIRWDGVSSTEYTIDEGFVGKELNRSACITDHKGNLWFGTDRGVAYYREFFEQTEENTIPPKVELNVADINGKYYDLTNDIVLDYHQNSITFIIKIISFYDEKNITCQVKLEGIDEEWTDLDAENNRSVKYVHLPPGSYRFHVRAKNSYNLWSPTIQSGKIRIQEPFWSTWWFYFISIAFSILVSYLMFRLISSRRYNRKLSNEVNERTRQLQLSESRYRQMFENNRSIMFILDPESGDIIDANPSACDFYACTHEQLTNLNYTNLCLNKEKDVFAEFPVSAETEFINFSTRHRLFSGEEKDVEIFANRLLLEEDLKLYLIVHDITEKKKMESELQKANQLESIGILAGGLAHDFNNILTAIMGYVSLARMKAKDNSKVVDTLQKTMEACYRAKDLTHQLLIFSKGGIPSKRLTSIQNFIKESTQFILRGTNVSCEFKIPDDLWNVEVDVGQINQVLNNIVINAIQAMPNGGKITISSENCVIDKRSLLPLKFGNYVKIKVDDQGVGISNKDIVKVFNPYFTTKETGNGLGLTISHSIINKHGGYITLESSQHKGTSFIIYLPALPGKKVPLVQKSDIIQKGEGRILVMDDHEDIRDVAHDMLIKLGYQVECAVHGEEAIQKYQEALDNKKPFDAVIIDLTVQGGMGGFETIQKLLEIDPQVKAIVSSGYSNDPIMANFRNYGFRSIISKPYNIKDLSSVLHDLLKDVTIE